MAAPEGPEISAFDDQYGMQQLLTRKQTLAGQNQDRKSRTGAPEGLPEHRKVLRQFSGAPCRASMKLPPIPREEGGFCHQILSERTK